MLQALTILSLLFLTDFTMAASEDPAELGAGLQNPGYEELPAWFKTSFLDLTEDVAEAAAEDKRVLLYFYQDGCPYCAKLLRDNFTDREIVELTRQGFDVIAINLWGDREVTGLDGKTTTEKKLATLLGVQFTPTLLFLDEAGKVVLRLNGYLPPHRFAAALRYVAERHERTGERFSEFYVRTNPREAEGDLHQEAGFLAPPLRLGDNRRKSPRPLVVMLEQPVCRECDELHQDVLRREAVALSLAAFDAAIVDVFSREPLQTPDGRETTGRDWAAELGIEYTPSLVFYDTQGREVFRTEGYLKAFHVQGALDYVATGAYRWQPSFQRYLSARREALAERGIQIDIMR
ncbi:thioredoxin family protein [Imhoffiella purpurea]|uniref:Thioredoxin SoxW n=1 Tax=Imhoffiella purpurea TaxID=1249627 RepID=W9VSZ9_9GAMM|nr:thioredoxin fold domain-containing protein [Imhoffiella purpurea]EXJ13500.1 thioredoxin SoxW [Imhoffiella purpurea]